MLQTNSSWPVAAIMAAMLLLASTPLFRGADSPAAGRDTNVDGLRGFLALGVFLSHAQLYRVFTVSGEWGPFSSPFYKLIGHVGVALFFLITGYLFWGKVIAERGRCAWVRLAIGRVFRIGPVYLLVALAAIAVVLVRSGFALQEPADVFARGVARWLALGVLQVQDLNGQPKSNLLLNAVIWTLRYEWGFYVLLPALALAARLRGGLLALSAVGLPLSLLVLFVRTSGEGVAAPQTCLCLFLGGMTCALARSLLRGRTWSPHACSAGALVLLAVLFAGFDTAYQAVPVMLCTGIFFLIVQGGSLFGLLPSRAARRLGAVSYPIYITHGVLLALFHGVPAFRSWCIGTAWQFWASTLLCSAMVVLVALLLHVWVEQPGISLGRRVASVALRPAQALPHA